MIYKVLVTGSEGYIGQHLCGMLENNPLVDLYKLDINGNFGHKNFRYDIRSADQLRMSNIKAYTFDAIIHLAALVRVGESVQRPWDYYDTNVNGTHNLLKHVSHKNFIFASTGAAADPLSPYGFSKRIAEDIIKEKSDVYTIFRFYNVTGSSGFPATNPDGLFYNLVKAKETGEFNLYGTDYNTADGTCIREYVHVNDICRSLAKAILNPTKKIENLAYGDTRSVKEIIEIFKEVNQCDFKVVNLDKRPGDLESMYLNEPSELMTRNYSYEEMLKV